MQGSRRHRELVSGDVLSLIRRLSAQLKGRLAQRVFKERTTGTRTVLPAKWEVRVDTTAACTGFGGIEMAN